MIALPSLPYDYNELEPYIEEQIMRLHHTKHHQAYITALNDAEHKFLNAPTLKQRLALQSAIKFNGGGHINHSLFWTIMAPSATVGKGNGGVLKDGPLKAAINDTFCSLHDLITKFNEITAAIQGSGWGWLGYNTESKTLEIVTTANQDPLLSHVPIIGVDIWEHAYYLQYFNVRAEYLAAIWNVINFDEAKKRFLAAVADAESKQCKH